MGKRKAHKSSQPGAPDPCHTSLPKLVFPPIAAKEPWQLIIRRYQHDTIVEV